MKTTYFYYTVRDLFEVPNDVFETTDLDQIISVFHEEVGYTGYSHATTPKHTDYPTNYELTKALEPNGGGLVYAYAGYFHCVGVE